MGEVEYESFGLPAERIPELVEHHGHVAPPVRLRSPCKLPRQEDEAEVDSALRRVHVRDELDQDRVRIELERAASARERGRSVLYVTERAVFSLNDEGLVLTEIAPGVDLERDVLDQAGGTIRVSPSLKPMCPAIFQPKPMGLATREPWTKEQVA